MIDNYMRVLSGGFSKKIDDHTKIFVSIYKILYNTWPNYLPAALAITAPHSGCRLRK
jgi:hypothetical protein